MDSDDPQQPTVGESAGKQLKRAREKLGLSIKDIAEAQHLRVSIIQAIEDGDYQQIDTDLFLKGYVRGYARQVGADANALVRSLDVELEPLREQRAKQEQENPLVDIERRRLKKRRVAKALGIIVVLCGIAFAVWKLALEPRMLSGISDESQTSGETVSAETGEDLPESSDVSAGTVSSESADFRPGTGAEGSAEIGEGSEPAALSGSNSDIDSTGANPGADLPTEEAGDSVNVAVNSVSESATPVVATTELVEDDRVTVATSGSPGPGAEADEAPVQSRTLPEEPASQAGLEMSFVADCWVQVMDSTGSQLVASLQRAGDEISVSGQAPLKVVIGAVDAVGTIRFEGETVDVTRARVINNRTELTLTL